MAWSSCPFCFQQVLSIELQRHANNHFEEEDLTTNIHLLDHDKDENIAINSTASSLHVKVDNTIQPEISFRSAPERYESRSNGGESTSGETKHSFIELLNNCLECDAGNSTSILSGYVDHFQSLKNKDVGWGCGWRNIQMLSSHLLVQREEAREVLFGGCGFVPDIPSLQRWLEIAWEKGFDTAGSNDFDQKIYGKRSWIGTTECAALFRSFGLRARIVDFCSSSRDCETGDHGKRSTPVVGPMDKYVKGRGTDAGSSSGINKGHQLLANWVWSYFSDDMPLSKSGSSRVVVTEKMPLYFQHEGHSRTIIGIQLKRLPHGMQQYNLLILDPAHETEVLESCLMKKAGWQRFIKRGVHTLKKKLDYQLCFIDSGIASGAELEKLKTLDSTRFEI